MLKFDNDTFDISVSKQVPSKASIGTWNTSITDTDKNRALSATLKKSDLAHWQGWQVPFKKKFLCFEIFKMTYKIQDTTSKI